MTIFGQTLSRDLGVTQDLDQVDQSQKWVLSAMGRFGQDLVTLLWRILGNEQDVCDVYQTTFLRLAHIENNQRPKHIKAYLFRTASNTAISLIRTRTSEKKRISQASHEPTPPSTPDNEISQKQLVDTLRTYVAQLPKHLQDVVALRDLAELPYSEVAHVLGITPGTARVYRCKAVTLLAAWMNTKDE
ncbi:MAG: sigma-70 family RNA polymerase sigma factor [Planctomycetes bacterium]|nr:sigma-70 family RNA polymerase sigma factor [Planctomycetota bacterium]